METLYEQLGHRRIPGDQQSNKKFDLTLLSTEIRPEETAAQVNFEFLNGYAGVLINRLAVNYLLLK
jgi:hypothetical protein